MSFFFYKLKIVDSWGCYRWVEGHFWSKANQVMGLSFFSEFQFENFIFSSLVKCLIVKGFVNIEVTQNFEKNIKTNFKKFQWRERKKDLFTVFGENRFCDIFRKCGSTVQKRVDCTKIMGFLGILTRTFINTK